MKPIPKRQEHAVCDGTAGPPRQEANARWLVEVGDQPVGIVHAIPAGYLFSTVHAATAGLDGATFTSIADARASAAAALRTDATDRSPAERTGAGEAA